MENASILSEIVAPLIFITITIIVVLTKKPEEDKSWDEID